MKLALALIDAYKLLISPYFAGSCRFLPSCADYAREAVIRHGALRGTWLAALRLSRCQPLSAGGHDPVPPVGARYQRGANGHGANGHGANGHGANGHGANGRGANGHGAHDPGADHHGPAVVPRVPVPAQTE
jgi:putative membrane protein insertion efficiency factor